MAVEPVNELATLQGCAHSLMFVFSSVNTSSSANFKRHRSFRKPANNNLPLLGTFQALILFDRLTSEQVSYCSNVPSELTMMIPCTPFWLWILFRVSSTSAWKTQTALASFQSGVINTKIPQETETVQTPDKK